MVLWITTLGMTKEVVIGNQCDRGIYNTSNILVSDLGSGDTDIFTLWSLNTWLWLVYFCVLILNLNKNFYSVTCLLKNVCKTTRYDITSKGCHFPNLTTSNTLQLDYFCTRMKYKHGSRIISFFNNFIEFIMVYNTV